MPQNPTPARRRRALAAAVDGASLVAAPALAVSATAVELPDGSTVSSPQGEVQVQQQFEDGRYFVVLKDQPSVTAPEAGAVPGAAPKAKFDPSHPRVKNYEAKLQRQQAKVAKAHGAKAEAETAMKGWIDRWLADRDFVTREEFEAVREMAIKARTENAELKARLDALEAGR